MSHRMYIRRIFAALLAVVFLTGFAQPLYVSAQDGQGYMEFVTTANLNLRSGPSTSYPRITLIPEGTVVFISQYVPDNPDEYYAFSSVMFGEISGYVASRFIEPRAMATVEERIEEISQMPLEPWVEYAQAQVAAATPEPATPPVAEPAPAPVPADPTPPPAAARSGNVENISWWTMRDSGMIPTGTTIQIFDIRSGLTYYVRNFSNGNHADVETVSQRDTDIMRQTSGGFSWDARPVLATFNGRTFAAAIHTMPHAGYTISGNGMNGHICLHFLESTPHNGNRSWQAEMQAAVRIAANQ